MMLMPYEYFEHEADTGVIGRGDTPEEAFERAALATFAVMVDPDDVRTDQSVRIEFEEGDLELALVTWLNRLLGLARERGLIFGRFQLERHDGRWAGVAWGEPWREDLQRGVEVKGATLTGLSVRRNESGWEARCVVDV